MSFCILGKVENYTDETIIPNKRGKSDNNTHKCV